MTEGEWLSCTDPNPMLEFLRGKVGDRKVRLFACACCRLLWHLVEDERSRNAVEVSERYADGIATRQKVVSARGELKADYRNKRRAAIATAISERAAFGWALGWDTAHYTLRAKAFDAASLGLLGFRAAFRTGLASDGRQGYCPDVLLHDLFANPFRPVTIHPAWLTPTVTDLAIAAYEERFLPSGELDNTRLAVLADALEESGCDNADILTHLRGPGPHVRGCWVVDLLLAKE